MKIRHQLAQHLIDVHRGENWTGVSIANTLKEVSWVQTSITTPFSPNSLAMLLHHITYWNRIVAQRAQGIEPKINDENGMNAPIITCQEDWLQLQKDNFHSSEELATIIEGYDIGNLFNPILPGHSSAYRNFQGQIEHIHYHLGQMLMIKNFLALQNV
ncbi:MAG TPA: DinB family protein [Niabella sp.]|nr:DinB family protein [Niabella sp.]HOZ96805.1 DinB family protein [Niabella sp.]HQW14718.1 DinB family protein [Niabella sp.]HQX20030.1 DinB family protein [Niabella sp.]HQX40650.1 DinB family protein [Niabella sp.]